MCSHGSQCPQSMFSVWLCIELNCVPVGGASSGPNYLDPPPPYNSTFRGKSSFCSQPGRDNKAGGLSLISDRTELLIYS